MATTVLLALSCSAPGRVLAANAATVALAGTMGDKVVLVIDGRTRVMTVGETVDGLRVQRGAGAQSVVLDSVGGRQELVVGAAPVAVGPAGGGRGVARKLVLQAGTGHQGFGEGEHVITVEIGEQQDAGHGNLGGRRPTPRGAGTETEAGSVDGQLHP